MVDAEVLLKDTKPVSSIAKAKIVDGARGKAVAPVDADVLAAGVVIVAEAGEGADCESGVEG